MGAVGAVGHEAAGPSAECAGCRPPIHKQDESKEKGPRRLARSFYIPPRMAKSED